MKKIGALLLAIVMVLSVSNFAMASQINEGKTFAAPTLDDGTKGHTGEAGTWTEKDTAIQQVKNINIVKEIIAFNANSSTVYTPDFKYIYTVTPADVEGKTVQDEDGDHVSNKKVTVPVQAGETEKLVVSTITSNGTAGNKTQALGELVFTTNQTLTTIPTGQTHSYNINLDFSDVVFSGTGVYRYQIVETIVDTNGNPIEYKNIAIKDGGTNTLYLDVYVDGNKNIYGYVCMAENSSVTSSTAKTNKFGPDNYYTYDLELSKDVVNDTYATSHPFPFTVIFKNDTTNGEATGRFQITKFVGDSTSGTKIEKVHTNPDWNTVSQVADVVKGTNVIYRGIPASVDVDVYETNDMSGVTYTVTTKVNDEEKAKNDNVSWGNKPTNAVAQADPKANAYESTKVTVDTTLNTAVEDNQTVAITNKLLLISPTGVVLRIAPYAMILAAGIALLLISRRRTATVDED